MATPTRRAAMAAWAATLVLAGCGGGGGGDEVAAFGPAPVASAPVQADDLSCGIGGMSEQMLAAINEARASARSCGGQAFGATTPLGWNAQLASAAGAHASDMAVHNVVSHTGSDGSRAADRAGAAGYTGAVGENLAGGQASVPQVMKELLASAAHCANIMDPSYRAMGAACVKKSGTTYKTHWVQMLGR